MLTAAPETASSTTEWITGKMAFCSYFWKTFSSIFFLWHSIVKAFEITVLHCQQWLQDFQVGEVWDFFPSALQGFLLE